MDKQRCKIKDIFVLIMCYIRTCLLKLSRVDIRIKMLRNGGFIEPSSGQN